MEFVKGKSYTKSRNGWQLGIDGLSKWENVMKSARVIFQTKEGKAVVAAFEKGEVKLYTDDKKAIYKALETDLKSPNYFDRQAALCMLETLNKLGLEELKP